MDWSKEKEEYLNQGNKTTQTTQSSNKKNGKIDWSQEKAEYNGTSSATQKEEKKSSDELTEEIYSSLVGYDNLLNDIQNHYTSSYYSPTASSNNFYNNKLTQGVSNIDNYLNQLKEAGYSDDDQWVQALNAYKSDFQNLSTGITEENNALTEWNSYKDLVNNPTGMLDKEYASLSSVADVDAEIAIQQSAYDNATNWNDKYSAQATMKYLEQKRYSLMTPEEIQAEIDAAEEEIKSAKLEAQQANMNYSNYEETYDMNSKSKVYGDGTIAGSVIVNDEKAKRDTLYNEKKSADDRVTAAEEKRAKLGDLLAQSNYNYVQNAQKSDALTTEMQNFQSAYESSMRGGWDMDNVDYSHSMGYYDENGLWVNGTVFNDALLGDSGAKDLKKKLVDAGFTDRQAADWIETVRRGINQTVNEEYLTKEEQEALQAAWLGGNGKIAKTLGTFVTNQVGGLAGTAGTIAKWFDDSSYGTYDPYAMYYMPSQYTEHVRSGAGDKEVWDEESQTTQRMKALGFKIGKYDFDLYSTLTSSVDSIISGAIGAATGNMVGAWAGSAFGIAADTLEGAQRISQIVKNTSRIASGLNIGSQVATSTIVDYTLNGATQQEALTAGIISGCIEALFEEWSIENMNALAQKPFEEIAGSLKAIAGNFAKSFVTNASEEFNTELANILYQAMYYGEFSDYERYIQEYHTENPNDVGADADAAARQYAIEKCTKQIMEAGISGGFQALLMGGGGYVKSFANSKLNSNQVNSVDYQNYGRFDPALGMSQSQKDISDILKYDPENAIGKKYNEKINNSTIAQGLSVAEYNELTKEAERVVTNHDQTLIADAVKNRLEELGATGNNAEVSQVIAKTIAGEKLTRSERTILNNSMYAEKVINELNRTGDSKLSDTQWTHNIGTDRVNAYGYNLNTITQGYNEVNEFFKQINKGASQRVESTGTKVNSTEVRSETIKKTGNDMLDSFITSSTSENTTVTNGQAEAILKDSNALSILRSEAGLPESFNGMSGSQQRNAIKAAMQTLAENYAKPKAASPVSTSVSQVATKYGKMSKGVESVYNLNKSLDAETFDREFAIAYEIGKKGGTASQVLSTTAISNLTETQKRLAYAFGKAESTSSRMANAVSRKGTLSAKGTSLKDINKKFVKGSNQKNATQMLYALAEATGFNICVYDSKFEGGYGSFDPSTNTIYIDINAGIYDNMSVGQLAKYTMLRTFCHEFTHAGEHWAAEEYEVLRAAVVETYAKDESFDFDKAVNRQIANNYQSWLDGKTEAYIEQGLSREEAIAKATEWVEENKWDLGSKEVVAEGMTDVLPESKFVENLYKKSPSVFSKLRDALGKFLDRIKSYWAGIQENDSSEAAALKYEMNGAISYYSDILDKFDAMAEAAVKNKLAAAERYEERHNPETAKAEHISKQGFESIKDSKGEQVFQLRTMKQDVDAYMQDLKDAGLVGEGKVMSEADLNYLYNSINRIMDYVEQNIDAIERSEEFREMDGENRPFLPYKDNADPHYKKALDFSTLCRKRLLTQAITEKLQRSLKRALNPVEQVHIRNEIKKLQAEGKKLDVACALCYVEAARLKTPKVINAFLNDKTVSIQNYYSLKNKQFIKEVYEQRQGDWKEARGLERKATKDQIKAAGYKVADFNKFSTDIRKNYWAWLEQANPEEFAREKAVIDKANSMDNADFLSAKNLAKLSQTDPDLYDAFITKVRQAARSKAQETDVPYKRGDINQVGDAIIEQMNEESGFRHQSWSDFQAMHMLDTIASIIELSTKGAKMHTYTKVYDMVRFLGETGMMMNMSLIPAGDTGFDANGELEFDSVEGMPYEQMMEMRNKYHSTAGNIAIGISDEQILALLNSPYIDYVIPYHTSGLNADMRRRMGIKAWQNYTNSQNEKGGKGPSLNEWFSEKDAMSAADGNAYMVEASQKYLDLCYERGLTPKFPQFLNKNSDGSYSLREDAQNYWKLLIDRKMVDQVTNSVIIQKAVTPTFNVDTMLDILDAEVNSQAAIDAREAEDYIVNKMLSEDNTFTKEEKAKAKILNDAALRMAVESAGVTQNQYRGVSKAERITAEKLEAEGKSKSEIWKATGLFRSYDNFWRAEIKDNKAKVKLSDEYIKELQAKQREAKNKIFVADSYVNEVSRELEEVNRIIAKKESNGEDVEYWKKQVDKLEPRLEKAKAKAEATRKEYSTDIKLSDILEHDELFKYYPELKDVNIYFEEMADYGGRALYGSIILNTSTMRSIFGARNTLFHEIQHEIQMLEGFAQGSNKSMFTDDEYSDEIGELIDRRTEVANKLGNILKRNGYSIKMDEWDRFGSYFKTGYNRQEDGLIGKYWYELSRLADNNKRTKALLDEYYEINSELLATTSYGKYLNTAGEIEARDAAFRADLSDEDIEKYEPDTGNKNAIVFGVNEKKQNKYVSDALNIKYLFKDEERLEDARSITDEDAINYLKEAKSRQISDKGYIPVKAHTPQVLIDGLAKKEHYVEDLSLLMNVGKSRLVMRNPSAKEITKDFPHSHALTPTQILEILNNAETPNHLLYQPWKWEDENKISMVTFTDFSGVSGTAVAVFEFYPEYTPGVIDEESGETEFHTTVTVFEPATTIQGEKFNYYDFLLDKGAEEIELSNEKTDALSEPSNGATRTQGSNNTSVDDIVSETNPTVKQNQQRRQNLSDREVLSQASESISRENLTQAQKEALDTFDKYLAEANQYAEQRAEQNELIKQYRKDGNVEELQKAINRRDILSNKYRRAENKLLDIENSAVAKQILRKGRQIVEAAQDVETSNRLEKYYTDLLKKSDDSNSKLATRKAELEAELKKVRADRDAQLKSLRAAKNSRIDEVISEKNARIEEAKQKGKEKLKNYKENQSARGIRESIFDMAEDFRDMINKPGKNVTKHAPVSLTSAIANFCDIFDENRRLNIIQKAADLEDRKIKLANGEVSDRNKPTEAARIEKREEQLAKQNAAIDMLKLRYDSLKNDDLYKGYHDEHTADLLNQAKELLTEKNIFDMNTKELTGIKNLMKNLMKDVVDANKSVAMKKGQEISGISEQLAQQIDDAPLAKKTNFGRTAQKYEMWQMRPDTFFSYITGYAKNSVGEEVQKMFVDGTERMLTMQREFYHMMSKLTESKDKNIQKALNQMMTNPLNNMVDWGLKDRNGNTVMTPKGMMLQAYMLLDQEDSFNSLVYGGFKIPRMKAYYGGKMSEAYSGAAESSLFSEGVYSDVYRLEEEAKEIKSQIAEIKAKIKEGKLSDAELKNLNAQVESLREQASNIETDINEIVSGAEGRLYKLKFDIASKLTDVEKQVLQIAREWYDYSGEKLDEVFLEMYGYKPNRPKNYTTIHRSLDTVATDIRSVDAATNLENFGSTKERVKSKDPILLTDIFNELNGNVQRMSKYYGYVEAQKDFNRIWNYKKPGTQSSIKAKIGAKFLDGDNIVMPSGTQYVENYIKNISGANADREGASPFHALYSGLAGANLSLNPRVAVSQLASIPTAAAEVGFKNMAIGFTKGFGHMFSTQYKRELAEKSVWYWQRYRGEGGITESADLMNNPGMWNKIAQTKGGKLLLNWCQAMDTMATAAMWSMAEEQVKQNGISKNSENYIAEVEKVFRDIIRRTQPNYTTTERSDLLRDKRDSMKLLTMYKTQSNQNLNILMEANGKFRKMKADFKAGKNGVTKADVKAATKNLANAYTGVIIGGTVAFAALRTLVNIALGKVRDDDDEFTLEAVGESFLKDSISSLTGMFSVGSQVYDFIYPLISGDNYYGLSDSAFGAVSDLLEQTNKIIQKAKDEDKAVEWKDVEKEISAVCNIIGIPWRNGSTIYKAVKMYIEDIQNGTFGSFEGGVERGKGDEKNRFLNGYLDGDDEKIGRALSGYLLLVDGDEKQASKDLASSARDWYKKGKIDIDQYKDILKTYCSAAYDDDDITEKVAKLEAEDKLGDIKSDDWENIFNTDSSPEDIDDVVAQFGGEFKKSYKGYRSIGYEPKAAYEAAQKMDADKNGKLSQYEVYKAIKNMSKTNAEKIWNSMGFSTKYSDYKPSATDEYKAQANSISDYNDKNWKNALTDKNLKDADKDTLVLAYGGGNLQSPYKELRNNGYSPQAAYNVLTTMDSNDNNSISQDEALAYIRSQGYTGEDAEAIWNMFGWKKSYQYYSSKH